MLQSATGSLVLVDTNTATPSVFWRGKKIEVEGVAVMQRKVTLRVQEGAVSLALLAELQAAGIDVKGVKK